MIYVVRGIHSAFALFFIGCLAYIYYAALGRKRSPLLAAGAGALLAVRFFAAVTAFGFLLATARPPRRA
jgi:hypothetical protein